MGAWGVAAGEGDIVPAAREGVGEWDVVSVELQAPISNAAAEASAARAPGRRERDERVVVITRL
jgi:hypothetical protein